MSRLLFVHAHPDDETLTCGITMAHHVALGDEVHVLTCTLGEEGEVVPPELAHLQGAEGDPLGPFRLGEVREAMRRLGVHHAVLGADEAAGRLSRFRDTGMAGMPSAEHPRAFGAADVEAVGSLVADHLRALRPDVVVTYDSTGGYEHPDHVQTHRVDDGRAAAARGPASDPPTPSTSTPRGPGCSARPPLAARARATGSRTRLPRRRRPGDLLDGSRRHRHPRGRRPGAPARSDRRPRRAPHRSCGCGRAATTP